MTINPLTPANPTTRLTGCAALLVELDPTSENACAELAAAIRIDPHFAQMVLSLVREEGGAGPATSIEEATLRLGTATVRALAIALDLCVTECRDDAGALRWSRPLAQAFASRAISRQIRVGVPIDAFTLGLVYRFGPETLSAWRMPGQLVQVAAPGASAEAGFDPNEDEAAGLARILGQASLIAEALHGDPAQSSIDWARASSGLDAMREILEIDRPAFQALFERVGQQWSEWHASLGLPMPHVPTLDEVHRRAGEILPDDDVVRALESGSTTPLKGLRILAVDDEPSSLKILERALRKAGHDVITAVNGSDALRLALELHPHAVIADWMMPEMDGIDLCKALRRSELGRSVFFLLLTGRGEEDRIVEAFDAGVDDYVTKPFNAKILLARLKGGQRVIELQERVEANRRVVMKQVAEMGLLTRKLRNAAHTDPLTELPNRRYAMARLEAEWETSHPGGGRPLSAILIDIDHFKKVNDTYGHDVGDLVLKAVAVALRTNTRQGEEAARLGGEEFFVVCANTNEEQALIAGERLRSAIETQVIHGLGFQGSVTISVGVAQRTPDMTNQDALIKASDHAVYAAKAAGRNRVVAFSGIGSLAQSA
ncbi:MAG: diguanylate cyclase [Planctomycetota bacterium]|nr:diguanylate cyclase [Planctomycetota bacterium]